MEDDKIINLGEVKEEKEAIEEAINTGKIPVVRVMEQALKDCEAWDNVLILAVDKAGDYDCRASTNDSKELLYLSEAFKHNILFNN